MPRLRDMALHHRAPDSDHLTPSRGRRARRAVPATLVTQATRAVPETLATPATRAVLATPATRAVPETLATLDTQAATAALSAVLGALLLIAASGAPGAVRAADPTPEPAGQTASPPNCADRFPEEGPAGVDLRLGCIVSEVVGLYTVGQAAPPPPLSSYAIFVGVLALAAIVVAWIVARLIARRAGRRLAPVLAGEWWICGSCRSVNGSGVAHCYSCGSGRPDGPMLTTDEHPEIPQSFGSRRKRG